MKKEYKQRHTEEDFQQWKDGVYWCEYDPNMETDFWPPNDEEMFVHKHKVYFRDLMGMAASYVPCNFIFMRDLTKEEEEKLEARRKDYERR